MILQAGRELLERDGADALTTNRIAERAGVSIGSLYRYFEDKEAVIAALYDRELSADLEELSSEFVEPLHGRGLREGLAELVDFQLTRHRRLLALEGDYYRDHHREFSLARRLGADSVNELIFHFLVEHADQIRVGDLDEAAFLVGRGVSAIVRTAVEEEPDRLGRPAFRAELIEMLAAYLTGGR